MIMPVNLQDHGRDATNTPHADECAARIARRRRVVALASLSASAMLLGGVVGGCIGDPPPFDPRGAQRNERTAAREVPPPPMQRLPTTLQSRFLADRGASDNTGTSSSNGSTTAPIPRPATGPAMGIEPQIRMSLQE